MNNSVNFDWTELQQNPIPIRAGNGRLFAEFIGANVHIQRGVGHLVLRSFTGRIRTHGYFCSDLGLRVLFKDSPRNVEDVWEISNLLIPSAPEAHELEVGDIQDFGPKSYDSIQYVDWEIVGFGTWFPCSD